MPPVGSVSEALAAAVLDGTRRAQLLPRHQRRQLHPLGDAANLVLLGEAEILDAALALCR